MYVRDVSTGSVLQYEDAPHWPAHADAQMYMLSISADEQELVVFY